MKQNIFVLVALSIMSIFVPNGCSTDNDSSGGHGPTVGVAVVSSDYSATSISLLDENFALVQSDCIDSGSVLPQLSQAFSGDVGVASTPQSGHELVIIDHGNSVLTWLDPTTCTPRAQLAVGTADGKGFWSNPHDVLSLSATKAYVARYERNSHSTESLDQGDDLLIIDPSTPAIVGSIGLAAQTAVGDDVSILPRPAKMMLINDKVYVTLGALSQNFDAAGPGKVVIVNPVSDAVEGSVELPYWDCEAMTYVSVTQTLVVGCYGLFDANQPQAATAGIVAIDLGVEPPVVSASYGSATFADRAVSGVSVTALSAEQVFVVVSGNGAEQNDELWRLSLTTGIATSVMAASGSYQLGGLFADATTQRLLIADGSGTDPKVRVFDASDPAVLPEISSFDPDPSHGLPPRTVAGY